MTVEKIETIKAILHGGIEGFEEQAKALDALDVLDHVICNGEPPVLRDLTEDVLREIATIFLVSPYANALPSNHPSSYINMILEEENLVIMPRKMLEKHLGEVLKARNFTVTSEITNYLKVNRGQAIYASLGDIAFRSREDARKLIETLPEEEQRQFDALLQQQKKLRDDVLSHQKEVMRGHDQLYINAVIEQLNMPPDILLEQGKQGRIDTIFAMAEKDKMLAVDLSGRDLSGLDMSGKDLHRYNLRGAKVCRANLQGVNLKKVDLTDTDLTGADLTGADITGARISAATLRGIKDIENMGLSEIDLVDDKPMPENPMIDGLDHIMLHDARALTLQSLRVQLEGQKKHLEGLAFDNNSRFAKINRQLHQNITRMEQGLECLTHTNEQYLPVPEMKHIAKAIQDNQKPLDMFSEQVKKHEAKMLRKKRNPVKRLMKWVAKKVKGIVSKFYVNEKTLASELYEEAASIEITLPEVKDTLPERTVDQGVDDQDRRQKSHLRKALNGASDKKIRDFREHDLDNPIVTEHNVLSKEKERV